MGRRAKDGGRRRGGGGGGGGAGTRGKGEGLKLGELRVMLFLASSADAIHCCGFGCWVEKKGVKKTTTTTTKTNSVCVCVCVCVCV